MMADLNLNAMAYFEAVARLGGVSRAAEELGVSPSAVSQQLRFLEQQFGVLLFRRNKQRLRLTDDGERLYQVATRAFGMMRDVRSAIVRQRNQRQFILRVSPSFGVRWLGPRIADFIRANPNWDIRIDATADFTAFDTEVVDLDLRYGEGGWKGLHEECVVYDYVLPLCAPGYLASLAEGEPDPFKQLSKARLIDSVKTLCRWDFWLARHNIMGEQAIYPLRFDRSSMALQLAKDGEGVVLESSTLAIRELTEGSLVPFSAAFEVIRLPAYWLVCPPRHLNRRIVSIFSEWMREEGRAQEAEVRRIIDGRRYRIIESSELDAPTLA